MPRAFIVRLILSAIATACVTLVVLQALGKQPASELPLRVERGPQDGYVIRAREDIPLPQSLRDGESLALEGMSSADRAALFAGQNVAPGTSIELAVIRAGQLARVPVTVVARPRTGLAQLQLWIGGALGMSFVWALAMLTLWRGRDWAAWGLAAFSLAILLDNALYAVSTSPLASFWIQQTRQVIQTLLAGPALYVMAEALAFTGLSPRTRKLARIAVATLALSVIGILLARGVALTYGAVAWTSVILPWVRAAAIAVSAIPVLLLFIGYRHATHASRLRIRWVLWSTALLFVTLVLFPMLSHEQHPYLHQVVNAAQGVALLGYLYAVLRNRLVDVAFVVDRALLYTSITVVLFGMFSLLEYLLHKMAFSENLNLVFQALVVFLLAIALSPLHRLLERRIERVFFRQQHIAVAALRRFITECAFVERYERLLEFATERLLPHCAAVAIYERTGSEYERRAAGGHGMPWPETVDVDDPAFVTLRARNEDLDLENSKSAVSTDGVAFPMTVARNLIGAVICRPREGEQFAPDVRAALTEAARSLGLSLYILRNRERSRLVADIAAGRIDVSSARERALALL